MSWDDMSTAGKLATVSGVVFGIGYLTGAFATVHKHKNVLSAAQKGYAENAKLLKGARAALKAVHTAASHMKSAAKAGRVKKALFGDEIYWDERRMAEEQVLRMKLMELEDRRSKMTAGQEKQLAKLKEKVRKELPSAVEQTAVLGVSFA